MRPCVLPTPFGSETLTALLALVLVVELEEFELEGKKIGTPAVSWYTPSPAKPHPAPTTSTIRIGTMISVYFIFFGGVLSINNTENNS